jgi:hypothetical protein
MAVSAKMAKMLNSMFSKTNKELDEIASKKTGDSMEGMAARNEIDRRRDNKEARSDQRMYGKLLEKEEKNPGSVSKDEFRGYATPEFEFEFFGERFPKKKETKNPAKKEMAKGGMVKKAPVKKPAVKKPAVKKPAVKKPIKKGK